MSEMADIRCLKKLYTERCTHVIDIFINVLHQIFIFATTLLAASDLHYNTN